MDPSIYNQRRNELLSILGQIIGIDELKPDERREFERIRKKCLENQFNIVLMGEFQSGKSTIFDALCDGREISPRGSFIKTSACKITAQNLSDPDVEEYAKVTWKTDEELVLCMNRIFKEYIQPEELGYNPKARELFSFERYIRFDKPKHRNLMRQAIRQAWKERSRIVDTERVGPDTLRVASLILEYYDEFCKIRKNNRKLTIKELSQYVVFPTDWTRRWAIGDPTAFKPEEILFTFISSVDCFIHSPNLQRLGCTVTDCPGLFASEWDTKVAFETLPDADAVLYLFGGEKQMSQGDEQALKRLKSMREVKNKLFFSLNTRKPGLITHTILMANRAKLDELGFDEKNFSIHPFHALLFYLSELGKKMLDKSAEPFALKRFKSLAKAFGIECESYTDIWLAMVADCFHDLRCSDRAPEELTAESVRKVKEVSNSYTLFDEVERFILNKKAYSILVTNGAERARVAITNIEEDLKRKYREATDDVKAWEEKISHAREQLREFQKNANDILTQAFPDKVFRPLLRDGFKFVVEDRIEAICLKSAVAILPVVKSWGVMGSMLTMSKEEKSRKIESLVKPCLTEVIERELQTALQVWLPGVIRGENPEYEYIREEIQRISEMIQTQWKEAAESCEYIKSMSIPIPPDTIDGIEISVENSIDLNELTEMVGKTTQEQVMTDLVKMIVVYISGFITMFLLASFINLGLAVVIGVLVQIAISLGLYKSKERDLDTITDKSGLDKKEREIYDCLETVLHRVVKNDTFKESVDKGFKKIQEIIVNSYKGFYKNLFSLQTSKLNHEIEESRLNKQKSLEEQQKIAGDAQRLKEEKITPAGNAINRFLEVTLADLRHE